MSTTTSSRPLATDLPLPSATLSSAFPTPTMSHSDLSKPLAPQSSSSHPPPTNPALYSKALKKSLSSNSPVAQSLALSMPSPPMSPHPRLAKPLLPQPRSSCATPLSHPPPPSSSLLLLSTTAQLESNNLLASIPSHSKADAFPHKFPPMKSLPSTPSPYSPAPGTSHSKLAQLDAERRTIEAGPIPRPFAEYPTTNYNSSSSHSVPLVSCSWDAIRKSPRAILHRERAFLANYKPHGTYSSCYTVTAHASPNTKSIKSHAALISSSALTCSSASSPRKSSARRAPVYYDDSDGIATRSRHRTNQARARVVKPSAPSAPKPAASVLAIASLIEAESSPRKPLHFEPIAPAPPATLPPIAFASPVATPEPLPSTPPMPHHVPIAFSSINHGASSPLMSSPKRSPRPPKPSHHPQRKPRPTPIPSRVHDMDAAELPDYAPPASSLPPGKTLKTEWKGSPMDLSRDAHVHLLHPAEVQLAATLRLPAELYLDSKKRLFAEKVHRLRQGLPFRRTDSQKACRIDVNKASRLFSAYEKVGWLDDKIFAKFL